MADAPAPNPVAQRAEQLLESLWNDGKVGPGLRSKAKEMFPDIVLPEDTLAPALDPLREELTATRAQLEKIQKERDDERAQAEEAAMRRTLEDRIDAARSRFNLNDEGLDRMVARMKETGNTQDPEAAAAWVVQQTPPKQVRKADWLPKRMDLFAQADEQSMADYRQLWRDPLGYQDAQLQRFVENPDQYVRETLAA